MRRPAIAFSALAVVVTSLVIQSGSAVITPTLVQEILTASWTTTAPDPMGLSYDTAKDRLLVVDAEVEEAVSGNPPAYWNGVNFYESTRLGLLTRTVNISKKNLDLTPNPLGYTDEPADVAYSPANGGRYFIIDDQQSQIWDVVLGDGSLDPTDTKTTFRTHDFALDVEGLAFAMINNAPNLFVAAGEGPEGNSSGDKVHEIWRLQPGPNGKFDGPPGPANIPAGDDVATHFDTCRSDNIVYNATTAPCTSPINQADPEDVAYDPLTGHLFFGSRHGGGTVIVSETTVDGLLIDTYNLGSISGLRPSGIAVAPASGNSSARSIYITSRGVDNNSDRLANDGKIFEWQLEGPINHAPSILNATNRSTNEGSSVSLQISATDVDGDAIISYDATNLPAGLSVNATGLITGTIPYGAWQGGPKVVTFSATDANGLTGSAQFTWTVLRDLTPPAMPGALTIFRSTTGVKLDWPENTEADLAGYKVARASTAGGVYTDLTPTPLEPGSSEYFDDAAPVGATSYYKVTAIDKAVPPNVSVARTGSARRSKIVLVSQSSAAGAGVLLAIPKPEGVQPGDVLVAGIAARDTAAVVAPPGWTLAAQTPRVAALAQQVVYTHTVALEDAAAYTFIVVGRGPSVGSILAYRGAIERPSGVAGQVNATSEQITAPSLSPAVNDSVQIGFFGIDVEAGIDPPAAMMLRDAMVTAVTTVGLSLALADAVVDAAPTGVRIAIATSPAENVGQVVVLSPKP